MNSVVMHFQDLDKTKLAAVGGKGANLGELSKIAGIQVPDGFSISTEAFKRIIKETPAVKPLLDQINLLRVTDRIEINQLSKDIRKIIEEAPIPEDISQDICRALSRTGEQYAYAVRSSATAEDLPSASFAGQQDTYLNIIEKEAILKHISRCWASLFTERAVIYRLQNGFDHRKVQLAVVIQKMVFSEASGVLFTADPLTGHRRVSSIDASFGLGEAVVSGWVNTDCYKVHDGKIAYKKVSTKKIVVSPLKTGGTKTCDIASELQNQQVLTDEQILQLEDMGRTIEAHFGTPQDIEWCLAENNFYIVQSRPITTLYPIPEEQDSNLHVYISTGHQQMMTAPIKPLGISFWLFTASRPIFKVAAGRLFVDISHMLASHEGREGLLNTIGKSDPLTRDALVTIIERQEALPATPQDKRSPNSADPLDFQLPIANDPNITAKLIKLSQSSQEASKQSIQLKSGAELFDFILEDIEQLKTVLFSCIDVIKALVDASAWLNETLNLWLGEKNAADTLSQSVPNNITSEMGLALLDVADVIRPYPEIIKYLQNVKDTFSLDELVKLEGGSQSRDTIKAYLHKYGMRCSGEIDITQTRWSEKPTILLPMILSNIKNFESGASERKFEHGRQQALQKEQEILERLKRLPDGEQKAEKTKQIIAFLRSFCGYREYPKYTMINRYFIYKQALLNEAERLMQAGVIHEKDDIYYLTFQELQEVVRTHTVDYQIIHKRKDDYKIFEKLTPPRVMTSDGEIIAGKYKQEHLPAGSLAGLAVSSGTVEGRARVVLKMADANLEEGDILVTTFTDPSWTPLFVSIKGLVTEVGGIMTHGAVIAREYGLPAVVGVEHATKLIKDGQLIRVNGTEGYIELL